MPNEMQAGVYSGLVHYFKVLNTGVDPSDGKAVVDAMKALPTSDALFGEGRVRMATHTMYLLQAKTPEESPEPWDYFAVKAKIAPEEAFRPLNEDHCPLVGKPSASAR